MVICVYYLCVCGVCAVSRRGEKQQLPLQGYTVGLFTKKIDVIS